LIYVGGDVVAVRSFAVRPETQNQRPEALVRVSIQPSSPLGPRVQATDGSPPHQTRPEVLYFVYVLSATRVSGATVCADLSLWLSPFLLSPSGLVVLLSRSFEQQPGSLRDVRGTVWPVVHSPGS
jgi:hypothetical protein